MRSTISATFVLAAALMTGCAATVSGEAYGPDLVYVSPGVQVIADYDEPIFYTDGFYWRFYGGTWYRSTYYSGGWVYARPPVAVLRIDRPYAYAHYRPAGWAGRPRNAPPPGGWRGNPPPAAARSAPPPAAGGWRGGAPPPAAARSAPPPAAGGWRGGAPPPAAHPPPPAQGHPAPPPARGAPPKSQGGGWRGH
jgi:hypothetical protein